MGEIFEFNFDNNKMVVEFVGIDAKDEYPLYLYNKPCDSGIVEPCIKVNGPGTLKFGDKSDNTMPTVYVSGYAGIKSTDKNAVLEMAGRGTLIVDLCEINFTSFDIPGKPVSLENRYAIEGFSKLEQRDADDDYLYCKTSVYKETNATEFRTLTLDSTTDEVKPSCKFYFGKFKTVSNYEDLIYYLALRKENQGDGYLNIMIDRDIKIDNLSHAVEVGGDKRLFLNGYYIPVNEENYFYSKGLFEVKGHFDLGDGPNTVKRAYNYNLIISSCREDHERPIFYVENKSQLRVFDIDISSRYAAPLIYHIKGEAIYSESPNSVFLYNPVLSGGENHNNTNEGQATVTIGSSKDLVVLMVDGVIRSAYGNAVSMKNESEFPNTSTFKMTGGTIHSGDNELICFYDGNIRNIFAGDDQILYFDGCSTNGKDYDDLTYAKNVTLGRNVVGDTIQVSSGIFRPQFIHDLPDDLYLDASSDDVITKELTLVNRLNSSLFDFSYGKGYEAALFMTVDGVDIPYNDAFRSGLLKLQPYNSITFDEDNGNYIITVKSSLPSKFDGMQLKVVVKNNYSGFYTISNAMTIHVTEGIGDAVINLSANKDALEVGKKNGMVLEMGVENPDRLVNAEISSVYTNVVYAQWMDITDSSNPVAATAVCTLHLDKTNGEYNYTNFKFYPSVGSPYAGTHRYQLYVWTPSNYDDAVRKLSTSDVVTFTVVNNAPKIVSQTRGSIICQEGDNVNFNITVDDTIPAENVRYKWYYYPTYDHVNGIDQNTKKMTFNGVLGYFNANECVFTNSKTNNIFVYNLENADNDLLSSNLQNSKDYYRIVFDEAADVPGNNLIVKLTAVNEKGETLVLYEDTIKESLGNYEYARVFAMNPTNESPLKQVYLTLDFTASREGINHRFEGFYLQRSSDSKTWENVCSLNPYYLGDNYLGLYELDGASGNPLSYIASRSDDGKYIYCKVYNSQDPSQYVYSDPVELRVDPEDFMPYVYLDTYYERLEVGSSDDTVITGWADGAIQNNEWAVEYKWDFYYYDIDIYDIVQISESELASYGIIVSDNLNPSTGKASLSIRLADDRCYGLFNHALYVNFEATCLTNDDFRDSDMVELYWVSPMTYGSVAFMELYDADSNERISKPIPPGNLYTSYDDNTLIQDIIYLTDNYGVELYANADTHNDNTFIGYVDAFLDYPSRLNYEWKFECFDEDGVTRTSMNLVEYLDLANLNASIHTYTEDNLLQFKFTFNDFDETTGSRNIPIDLCNFVIYCVITDPVTCDSVETERYQISYLPLTDMQPQVEFKNPSIDYNNEMINYDLVVTTITYTMPIYIDNNYSYGDFLNYKLFAKNGTYNINPTPTFDGSIELLGDGYIENFIQYDVENEKFHIVRSNYEYDVDWNKAQFDNNKASSSYVYRISIPFSHVLDLLSDEDEIYYNYSDVEANHPEFTDDGRVLDVSTLSESEIYSYTRPWFQTYQANVYINLKLRGVQIASYKSSDYINNSVLLDLISAEYDSKAIEEFYNEYNYVVLKQNDINNLIGVPLLTTDYVFYQWYKVENGEKVLLVDETDAYLEVDNSTVGVYTYELSVITSKEFDDESEIAEKANIQFTVMVEPVVSAPVIETIYDKEFEYHTADAFIDLGIELKDDQYGIFVLEDYFTGDIIESDVPNFNLSNLDIGGHSFFVKATILEYHEIEGKVVPVYSETVTSNYFEVVITKRVIKNININGVTMPIIGEAPCYEDIEFGPISDTDSYIGVELNYAEYQGVSSVFEDGKSYTFYAGIDADDFSEFGLNVTCKINGIYDATVDRKSDSLVIISYEFNSQDNNVIDEVQLTGLPAFGVNSIVREVNTIKGQNFKALFESWNTTDTNFIVDKSYTLELIVTANKGFEFNENTKVYNDGVIANYRYLNSTEILVKVVYEFKYKVTVVINDESRVGEIDGNHNVALNMNAEIPNGYMFAGWYIDEELIADTKVAKYPVNSDLVITAKFKEIPYAKEGEYLVCDFGNVEEANIKEFIEACCDAKLGGIIKVNGLTIKFDKDTIKSIDNVSPLTLTQKKGSENASGNITAANIQNVLDVFEFSLNGVAFNGTGTISIPNTYTLADNETLVVSYVSTTGSVEVMSITVNDGEIIFDTTHFSTYVVSKNVKENNDGNKEKDHKFPWWIIVIIVVVLGAVGACLYFFVFKKKLEEKQEKPAENVEAAETTGVVFSEAKTLNEEYALLSKEDRLLFDKIKAHALELEDVKASEAKEYYTISVKTNKIIRLKIKKGEIICEFFANDAELKKMMGSSAKESSTSMKVHSEEDADKIIEIIDYKYNQIKENQEAPSEKEE